MKYNNVNENIFYKRNLPHYQPYDANYFITFRLAYSLPKSTIEALKNKFMNLETELSKIKDKTKREREHYNLKKRYFREFDFLLDRVNFGPGWLLNDKVAKIIFDALKYRDNVDYSLICFTIMPNHVHVVFRVEDLKEKKIKNININWQDKFPVTKILHSLKEFTARESNKVLNRTGQFWQHESYDHIIRNEKEFWNIVNYVLMNPVKVGLVKEWNGWKWSYFNEYL